MDRNSVLTMVLAASMGLTAWVVPCEARLVTVAVTAEVTEGPWSRLDFFQGSVQVGDRIMGTYTYDTAASLLDPPYTIGKYEFSSPPCGISLEVGGCTFQTDPNNLHFEVMVYDNVPAHISTIDRLMLLSGQNLPLDDSEVTAIELLFEDEYAFDARPSDPYHPMISLVSTALPTTAPELRYWPRREVTIQGTGFTITGRVTSAVLVSGPPKMVYVDDDAAFGGDGSSWDSAYRDLQDALADANAAQKPVEVHVAQGRYRPDQGASQAPGDREAAFVLLDEVTLKGGYAGLAGADPNARDPQLYQTVLTGDLLGDDLPSFRNRRDNSYHVVVALDTDESAILDGFVVQSGQADGLFDDTAPRRDDHSIDGGGLYVDGGSVTVRRCTFRDNYAYTYGGAALLAGLGSRIHHSTFVGNAADAGGGAYVGGRRAMHFQGCLFQGNSARCGGAMARWSGYLPVAYLVNCTITDNRAFQSNPIDNAEPNALFLNGIYAYNSILWNDRYAPDYRDLQAYYSNVHKSHRWPPPVDLDADPCFVTPGYWTDPNDLGAEADPNDPKAVWVAGDYHLKSEAGHWDTASQSWVLDEITSPCIDTGDPASFIDDEPEPNGARINMGAYGGTPEASKSYP